MDPSMSFFSASIGFPVFAIHTIEPDGTCSYCLLFIILRIPSPQRTKAANKKAPMMVSSHGSDK